MDAIEAIAAMLPQHGNGSSPARESRTTVNPAELKAVQHMDGSADQVQREVWRDRLKIQDHHPVELENTIEAQLNRFLEKERLRVEAKRLSASRFTSKRNNLFRFRDWVGSRTPVEVIDGVMIQGFHHELLSQIAADTLSQDTAHDRLGDAKGFIRWFWRMNILKELPRILEQGSNEHLNGLVRQYLPKGTSFRKVTHRRVAQIANQLNNRPRKRHGYQTPLEVFQQTASAALLS